MMPIFDVFGKLSSDQNGQEINRFIMKNMKFRPGVFVTVFKNPDISGLGYGWKAGYPDKTTGHVNNLPDNSQILLSYDVSYQKYQDPLNVSVAVDTDGKLYSFTADKTPLELCPGMPSIKFTKICDIRYNEVISYVVNYPRAENPWASKTSMSSTFSRFIDT